MRRRDVLRTAPAVLAAAALAPAQTGSRGSKSARLRTAICAYSYRDQLKAKTLTYEDLVRQAVDQDVDGLDLTVYWFPSTEDSFLLPLRRLAYKNAVEIYSISVRTDLCKAPGPERDKQAAELRSWVDVADKLGASHIRVFGGAVPKGSTEQEAAGWVADMLREGAKYAGSKGVILGIENHGGVTEKASTIVQIVKSVDSPWVGVNLDTGNFKRDAYNQIAQILPYAVNAQFKEMITVEPDRPIKADWPRLVKSFRDSGYRGYLALEYEGKDDAQVVVPKLTRELNQVVRQHA
jgi:L-ribulose-5-phosphate 3-epimerase